MTSRSSTFRPSLVQNISLTETPAGSASRSSQNAIVAIGASGRSALPFGALDLHFLEQGVRRRVPHGVVVLRTRSASAPPFRLAPAERSCSNRLPERAPEQLKIVLGEAGALGEFRRDESVGSIESVRQDVLAAHRALFFEVLFVRHRHAGYGDFQRQHGVDRSRKSNLYGAADLTGVHGGCHHGAKRADVEKFLHIQAVSSRALASSFGSLLASGSMDSAA